MDYVNIEAVEIPHLPCPFCGGEEIVVQHYEHGAGTRWRVMCLHCLCTIDSGTWQDKYRAISAWNTRGGKLRDPEKNNGKEGE